MRSALAVIAAALAATTVHTVSLFGAVSSTSVQIGLTVRGQLALNIRSIPEKRVPASGNHSPRMNIKLYAPGTSDLLFEDTVIKTATGFYGGLDTGLHPGTYDVVAKGYSHLSVTRAGMNLTDGGTIDFTSGGSTPLRAGDVDENDAITPDDITHIGSHVWEDEEKYDLNRDGVVNGIDLTDATVNLGQTGLSSGTPAPRALTGAVRLVQPDDKTSYEVGDCFRVDVLVETDGVDTNSVDVVLPYSPTVIRPYADAGCSVTATGMQTDAAFGTYPGNTIQDNQLLLTAHDADGGSPLNTGAYGTDTLLAHVFFKVVGEHAGYALALDFSAGSTLDTNLSEQDGDGTDYLDHVEGLSFIFTQRRVVSTSPETPGGGGRPGAGTLIGEPLHGAAPSCRERKNIPSPFADVPADSWFSQAVLSFFQQGLVENRQAFEPSRNAQRAELAALLVRMKCLSPLQPDSPHFVDAPVGEWYTPYVEEAAANGWMFGDDNCYGTVPCLVRPTSMITRAEAAVMILRYFGYDALALAPAFDDVAQDAWFAGVMQIAADHCVLRGVNDSRSVEPLRPVTRAELITMLDRGEQAQRYGADCGTPIVGMQSVAQPQPALAPSKRRARL